MGFIGTEITICWHQVTTTFVVCSRVIEGIEPRGDYKFTLILQHMNFILLLFRFLFYYRCRRGDIYPNFLSFVCFNFFTWNDSACLSCIFCLPCLFHLFLFLNYFTKTFLLQLSNVKTSQVKRFYFVDRNCYT